MVTRGSITPLNNQLLQNHQSQLTNPTQLNTNNLRRMAHVSPTITVHGNNNDASYGGEITITGQNSAIGLGNLDIPCNDFNNGVNSDNAVSSMTSMWP